MYPKTYFHWFHVQHFSDSALHDEEMWIVHIHADHSEEVGNALVCCRSSINLISVPATDDDLKVFN